MNHYVVGFLFDGIGTDSERVLLIEKRRPAWQLGKLNGVGGHVELGEEYDAAMVREFHEEAGVVVEDWRHFVTLIGSGWMVQFYVAYVDRIDKIILQKTDERLVIVNRRKLPRETLPNLHWLIPLALDKTVSFPVTIYDRG